MTTPLNADWFTYRVHVNAIGVRPGRVVGLGQSCGELFGDVMKSDELLDALLHLLVLLRSRIQPQHDG